MNDFSIVVGHESQNIAVNLLLGSQHDPTVQERTSFQLLDVQGGVRVLGSIAFITNPGSAFEKTMDVSTGKGGTEVQGYLERLHACSTTIIYSGQRQLKFPASVNYFSRPTTISPHSLLPREIIFVSDFYMLSSACPPGG